MSARNGIDIVTGSSPLLGMIETHNRASRILRINTDVRDVEMKGFRLPQPAAVQQDRDQDIFEAQLLVQERRALLAAHRKTFE